MQTVGNIPIFMLINKWNESWAKKLNAEIKKHRQAYHNTPNDRKYTYEPREENISNTPEGRSSTDQYVYIIYIRQGPLPSFCPLHVINNITRTPNTNILTTTQGANHIGLPECMSSCREKPPSSKQKIRETDRKCKPAWNELQRDTPCE